MPIGEPARQAGVEASALRYYERIGLLSPAECTGQGKCFYTADGAERRAYSPLPGHGLYSRRLGDCSNPLLTDFMHPKSSAWWICVVGDRLSLILRQCVKRKLVDEYKVTFYLRTLYRRLILDTRADVAVLLYYPTKPDTISARKAIILLNELNRESKPQLPRLARGLQRRCVTDSS